MLQDQREIRQNLPNIKNPRLVIVPDRIYMPNTENDRGEMVIRTTAILQAKITLTRNNLKTIALSPRSTAIITSDEQDYLDARAGRYAPQRRRPRRITNEGQGRGENMPKESTPPVLLLWPLQAGRRIYINTSRISRVHIEASISTKEQGG